MQNLSTIRSSSSVAVSHPPTAQQDTSLALALTAIQAADDRKGGDIILLRVTEVSLLADYFVLVTGYSKAQVRAIAGAVADKVQDEQLRAPIHTEGMAESTWVLQDYGDVIVHVLMPHEREFYNLEAFWGHAERIDFQPLLER
ncbi:MAG: ribosome silencing factor [Oscillatoriales cyanobacterium C42_A2020_001]|nr:ribosome silencing factor [Leptolyngbyaceae cyanobacterium C42_A2020_001]